jgi:hypothetical protein
MRRDVARPTPPDGRAASCSSPTPRSFRQGTPRRPRRRTTSSMPSAAGPNRSRPRANEPMGLELVSWFVRGNFHVRGHAGNGRLDPAPPSAATGKSRAATSPSGATSRSR